MRHKKENKGIKNFQEVKWSLSVEYVIVNLQD